MSEPRWVSKLKTKWHIATNKDFIIIMLVFSLAGMGICVVRPVFFHLLHIDRSPLWEKIVIYPFLVVPTYYVGLLIFGFLLGQFEFFRKFALKTLRRVLRFKNV